MPTMTLIKTVSATLRSDLFTDPDVGDLHAETQWQIRSDTEFSDLVLDLQSANFLTQLPLLDYMLDANRTYWWRARYFDALLAASEWSPPSSFTTVLNADDDLNGDGVPDAQDKATLLIFQSEARAVMSSG